MNSPSAAMYKSKNGWRRILAACGYSFAGLRAAWRYEAAFRQEVVLGLALAPLVVWAWINRGRWHALLLIGSILLVWVVELLNSAVEALADAVSSDHHPLLGRAKDIGSAAVMVSLILAGIACLFVLWPE